MKRYNIVRAILFLCMPLFVVACTDELISQSGREIREGIPVTVKLNLGVSSSKVMTRAAASEEAENTVNSVYVFAFNYDGSLDNKQIFTSSTYTTQEDCIGIDFSMHSGSNKRIYAIGNPSSGSGSLTANMLAGIETEDELLASTSSLLISTNIERSYFLMSGQMQVASGSAQIDVDEQGNLLGAEQCTRHRMPLIELERVDARVTFKIYASTTNHNYQDFTFIPDRYWVDNIPQHTYVFPHDEDYTEAAGVNYVSMSAPDVDVQRNVEGQDSDAGGDYYYFEFYIPENRLQPKKRIAAGDAATSQAENLYALREKKLKTPATDPNKPGKTEENGAFEYANDHSTYVVFHGTLSYTDTSNGQQFVYSDATYTVHLGSTGSADDDGHENDVDFVNDYNTYRNTHYTYTINITGVESMRVEVEDDRKEDRPGIEGDLIFSGEAVDEMDAHYGRTQFTLTRGAIKDGLSWAIRTPFQSGMKVFNADNYKTTTSYGRTTVLTDESDYTPEEWKKLQTDLSLNDYKWVQFLINNEVEDKMTDRQMYPKYPGYAAYVGDDYVDDLINEPAPPFGGNGTNKSSFYGNYNVKLYDVNQLLNHLYAEAHDPQSDIFDGRGDDATVTITAFVDEYVYVYNPKSIYYRTPQVVKDNNVQEGIDLKLWKEVVNRDNRMLYLCTTGAIYSPDGETSVSRNVFTIAQRPIYTFYNEKDPNVTTGWGTESINETGPLGVQTDRPFTEKNQTDRKNTTFNGLINTWNVLNTTSGGPLKWDDIMTLGNRDSDDDGVFSLNDGYDDIWHACIARNRDLNGDNIVQEEEVRWYLASIDQLTDLWIGEYSVNEAARLYTWDYRSDRNGIIRSHVASSSYNNGYTNPWKIWAEEGASRGAYNVNEDVNGTYTKTGQLIPQYDWTTYGSHVNRWQGEHVNDQDLGLIHYRCVRNLGISLNEPDKPFDSYVSVDKGTYTNEDGETYNELVISMDKMEANSVRSAIYQDAELPTHTERSYVNRPYNKFAVIMNDGYGSGQWGNTASSWSYYQDHNVCPAGYRMPNQRELMLMYIYIPQSAYADEMSWVGGNRRYMSGTGFGFENYYSDTREGFIYETSNSGVMFLSHGSETGYVRCVRDVP